ncbi:CBS domain-containing protein [Streptomyces sp. TRM66268-LWL]|uniref:CBS domain-containing protein n=1 Tax=Streptomyces polyasparticus TaxID=2767826 RepID=A0ABR7SII6_9ACTN|nr:CBS domain-containing protein [Streptomyces polyasparticus]MBC9715335.1 CBS domain-containing protein [Streptomyces polyasparticus]
MPDSPHIVSDVMTHTAVAVGRDAAFKEIVQLLGQWKISALPVIEGEGRVVGVVSEADLLPKEEFRDDDPSRYDVIRRLPDLAKAGAVTAGELMTSPAVTVQAGATLAEAARIMAHHSVKRLPVVDASGLLQGVVSRGDLLKVFLRPDEEIADEIRRSVVAQLPSAPDLDVRVADGVVTLDGSLRDRSFVPVLARAVRAVEGVIDIRMDFHDAA